jgi:hypothetical protein
MLTIIYQAEGSPGEVWDHALALKDAKLADGNRGQLIMINPPELPSVRIQVFRGGRITIYASDLYMVGRALVYLQKHLKIWRTEAAQTDPIHVRQVGSRPVADPAVVFISPAPNTIEEWRTNEEEPPRLVPKLVMRWGTVVVGASESEG